jgi:quercetin dioxygenase-like cupin family protein
MIIEGRVRVDTQAGSRVVDAGSVIVSSPAEEHATTALEDTRIFYVLIDPGSVGRGT